MTTVAELEATEINFSGSRLCCNPRCRRPIYADYVRLSSPELGAVILCRICWTQPINMLPEAQNAVAVDMALWKRMNPVRNK